MDSNKTLTVIHTSTQTLKNQTDTQVLTQVDYDINNISIDRSKSQQVSALFHRKGS